jgi:hypothetical protein
VYSQAVVNKRKPFAVPTANGIFIFLYNQDDVGRVKIDTSLALGIPPVSVACAPKTVSFGGS